MLELILQKKAVLLLTALLAVMFALMSGEIHRSGGRTSFDRALTEATAPVVRGGSAAAGSLAGRWGSLADLRSALERSRSLEREVQELRTERVRWEQERRENEQLRRLLGLRAAVSPPTITARLAGASPIEEKTVLIDRGSSDGVRPGLPVVAPAGVLGKVILVTDSLAKVLLLTDPASGVAVAQQDGRYQGMMVGRGKGSCQLLYMPTHADAVSGDLLVTTGLDRLYPPGLPAGRVVAARRGVDGTMDIEVRPEARPGNSVEVLVMLSAPGMAPAP